MKERNINNKATVALEDYFELLLTSDDDRQSESASKVYDINSNSMHQQSTLRPEMQVDRHNLERVERLLDDFNQRHPQESVLIQPAVLEPESKLVIPDVPSAVECIEFVREDWTEQTFQSLLFEVGGLTLALPLIKLGGIYKIEDEITPLIHKPDWFMGLTPSHSGNLRVIDTAKWAMPSKYQQAKDNGLNYEFMIQLGESEWALACSSVQNAIALSPDKVKWRKAAGSRPWLAGMLIDEMCALLDVDTLIRLLDEKFT